MAKRKMAISRKVCSHTKGHTKRTVTHARTTKVSRKRHTNRTMLDNVKTLL